MLNIKNIKTIRHCEPNSLSVGSFKTGMARRTENDYWDYESWLKWFMIVVFYWETCCRQNIFFPPLQRDESELKKKISVTYCQWSQRLNKVLIKFFLAELLNLNNTMSCINLPPTSKHSKKMFKVRKTGDVIRKNTTPKPNYIDNLPTEVLLRKLGYLG